MNSFSFSFPSLLSTLYSLLSFSFSFSFSLVFFTLLVDPLKELERIQILGVAILHG
jgi:hypothetical protein